ncbi:MAG: hypothetical protein JWN31_1357 [Frankiales bacterium]|nr:hypothetical protein [Frankiales bacterium]
MRIPRPNHATVVAYAALTLALSGTAYAATGGTFILGRGNAASTATGLTSSTGTPLSLNAKTGYAPLAVNSTKRVSRLNADLLDNLDSAALQRRVTGTCAAGNAVRAVAANGAVTCDDEKVEVQQVKDVIDNTPGSTDLGFGYAGCPSGFGVAGGGFVTGTDANPPSALTEYATPLSFTDATTGDRVDGYVVQLRNLDGTPYTGGGQVYAECVYGFSYDQPAAQTPARVPAALMRHHQVQRSHAVVRHAQ